jgi:hypothetical protein
VRVAPPCWRFLPGMLRVPPLRFLRNRYPAVEAGPLQQGLSTP